MHRDNNQGTIPHYQDLGRLQPGLNVNVNACAHAKGRTVVCAKEGQSEMTGHEGGEDMKRKRKGSAYQRRQTSLKRTGENLAEPGFGVCKLCVHLRWGQAPISLNQRLA